MRCRTIATLFLIGLIVMHIRSAKANDGTTYTHVGHGHYHKAGPGTEAVTKNNNLHAFFRPNADIDSGTSGARLDRPYEKSAWVRGAIRYITGPIQAVPLKFSEDGRGGKKLITDDELSQWWAMPARGAVVAPLLSRIFGQRPNLLTLADTIEATVGWMMLKGQAFWILGDTWLMNSAKKREPFIIANPDRMFPVRQGGELIGWRYTDGSNHRHVLLPEQVVQTKFWNPYDDINGSAPMSAAHTAAESDYLAGQYGLNLMRNNGDRGPIISTDGGLLSDEQQDQLVRLLREKQAAAKRGEFKPMFIPANVKVEDPKAQALDAGLIAQRVENRDEIAIAHCIPPSVFRMAASYSIGSASDRFRLIEEGCMPVATKIADAIELLSTVMRGGRSCYAWFDFSQHSTMQQVRSERLADMSKLTALGMPARVAGEYLSLDLPRWEGDDVSYLPYSVVPYGQPSVLYQDPNAVGLGEGEAEQLEGDGTDGTEPSESPSKDDPFEKITRLLTNKTIDVEASVVIGPRAKNFPGSIEKASRADLWRSRFARQRAYERLFVSKIGKVLIAARRDILRKLASQKMAMARSTHVQKAVAADFMFDLKAFTKAMQVELRKVARPALDEAGKEVFEELGKDDPWSMPDKDALSYLRIRDNKITSASEEMYERIKGQLEDGLTEGETMDQLSDRVRATFNDIDEGQAKTIATTETSAAFGVGRQRAMEVAGVQYKQWLTSGLPNVRATHEAADQQTVRLDQPFEVGTASLMHPGDPTGPAEEVINCRCVSIAVASPEPEEDEV